MLHWAPQWKLSLGKAGNVESLNSVNKHRLICNPDKLYSLTASSVVLNVTVEGAEQQGLCSLVYVLVKCIHSSFKVKQKHYGSYDE